MRPSDLAELGSLGISIAGLIAAAVTQQIIYAATPIGLYLPFSFLNRKRLEQQLEQQVNKNSRITGSLLVDQDANQAQINSIKIQCSNITSQLQKAEDKFEADFIKETKTSNLLPFILLCRNQPEFKDFPRDREISRNILMQALKESEERLILVCPWISYEYALEDLMHKIENRVSLGIKVDIGWGYRTNDFKGKFTRDNLVENSKPWLYSGIPHLEKLRDRSKKHNYLGELNLKLIGTHEKYLVCDRKFAMIGSHNFLMSSGEAEERELGIKIHDSRIINQLIERFDSYQ